MSDHDTTTIRFPMLDQASVEGLNGLRVHLENKSYDDAKEFLVEWLNAVNKLRRKGFDSLSRVHRILEENELAEHYDEMSRHCNDIELE